MISKQSLHNILIKVGKELKILKRKKLNFEIKGIEFKAEADLIAEKIIKYELQKISSFPILSEEDESSWKLLNAKNYWLIDPIDGTASFCEGFKGYVSQISLMQNCRPVLSAIYSPELDLFFYAEEGKGAFVNFEKIIKEKIKIKSLKIIDNYPSPRGITKKVYDSFSCKNYIESGSLGLKLCRVAQGYADIFIKDVKSRIWDLAPAEVLLRELGSAIINLNGEKINYSNLIINEGFVCTRNLDFSHKILDSLND